MLTLPVFIICTYILSTSAADENLECPPNSYGHYPFCSCENRSGYDSETNTCLFPECTVDESVGTNPNCTCQQKNFDYSSTFNVCFRVCPVNSTGYWPKCICDSDGYVFDKKEFRCIACPANSTGQYPNCNCGEVTTYDIYRNECTNPSPCEDGVYNELTHICAWCPYKSTGIYPNCVCLDPNSTYEKDSNLCVMCPANSTGQYPNCECEQPNNAYVQKDNLCMECPENSEGIYPNCNCSNGIFSKTHMQCMECPTDTTGFYPACECNDRSLAFSAFINKCYRSCPENAWGTQPYCECDDAEYYYDEDDNECKSNTGRVCPVDSIGIGPDCLCIWDMQQFNPYQWTCANIQSQFIPGLYCAGNDKWPQCEVSVVDVKLLKSLTG